jgi:predicted porin
MRYKIQTIQATLIIQNIKPRTSETIMKIRNTLAMTALGLALTFSAAQANELTVYGKLGLSLASVSDEANGDMFEVKSNASRFGIKGDHKISDSLTAFYMLEWQVDMADESKQNNISSRNQIIGLKGDFGSVFLGRHDTPLKKVQNKVDIFNDLYGDIKNVVVGENRMDNIVQYSSPKMGNFKFNAAIIPGEKPADNRDGLADGKSLSASWSNKNLYLGLAKDMDVKGVDSTRFAVQYKMGDWQLGGLFQSSDLGEYDEDGTLFSVAYKMGDDKLKGQYASSSQKKEGLNQLSLGWDRKLSKKTTLKTFITMQDEDTDKKAKDYIGVAIEHKF